MKKLTTTLFAMALCAMVFGQERFNPTTGSEVAYDVPKYVEPSWNEG